MAIKFSFHAKKRVRERLNDLTSLREIDLATRKVGNPEVGETWVKVKSLPSKVTIEADDHHQPVEGDVIYAIIRKSWDGDPGAVATVELRNSSQTVKGDYYYD